LLSGNFEELAMSHQHKTLVHRLGGTLTTADLCYPATVTLIYSRDDPYAVTADIEVEDTDARWLFARELLDAGLHAGWSAPAGTHHVFVWTDLRLRHPTYFLEIRRKGTYTFHLDHHDVMAFLRASYNIVPTGAEHLHIDIDGELDNVLA